MSLGDALSILNLVIANSACARWRARPQALSWQRKCKSSSSEPEVCSGDHWRSQCEYHGLQLQSQIARDRAITVHWLQALRSCLLARGPIGIGKLPKLAAKFRSLVFWIRFNGLSLRRWPFLCRSRLRARANFGSQKTC